MKLLKTINTDVAMYCQHQFGFKLHSELITQHTEKFIAKILVSGSV